VARAHVPVLVGGLGDGEVEELARLFIVSEVFIEHEIEWGLILVQKRKGSGICLQIIHSLDQLVHGGNASAACDHADVLEGFGLHQASLLVPTPRLSLMHH